jgi:hypothetical protein
VLQAYVPAILENEERRVKISIYVYEFCEFTFELEQR